MVRCAWFAARRARLRPALAALITLAAVCCCDWIAAGATFTWTGASPNIIGIANNWGNPLNWESGQIPVNDGTADVVIPDTDRPNSNVSQAWSIKSLTFQGRSIKSVNDDALTLNDITNAGAGTASFDNSVGVSGTAAVWRADNGPMVFNGAITGSNSVTIEAPEPITFGGSAANTITGAVVVTEGTLVLAKSTVSGAIPNILQIHDAVVRWDASDQVSDAITSQVIVTTGGVANFNGRNETVGQLILSGGGRAQSTGGVVAVAGQLGLQDSTEVALGAGELELRAAVIRSGASSSTSRISAATITLNKAQAIFSVADSPAAVELEVSGAIAGTIPAVVLQKSGAGALRLTGPATYQGGTTVETGTLIVDNTTGSATGTGSVTVATGALLTGDGAISGSVLMQNGAAITPQASTGFPIGSLTIGALSMNTTSEFQVQFNQALPVTSRRDVLTVTGTATLNGNLVLENLNANVFPDAATTFTVLTSSVLGGAFANVANGARLKTIDGTGSFVVSYGAASAFDTKNVVLSSFRLTGDFDLDGDVDGRDFLVWQPGGSPSPLSASDLTDWRTHFGAPGAVFAALRAVPEPGSGMLVLAGLVAAARQLLRRRFARAARQWRPAANRQILCTSG